MEASISSQNSSAIDQHQNKEIVDIPRKHKFLAFTLRRLAKTRMADAFANIKREAAYKQQKQLLTGNSNFLREHHYQKAFTKLRFLLNDKRLKQKLANWKSQAIMDIPQISKHELEQAAQREQFQQETAVQEQERLRQEIRMVQKEQARDKRWLETRLQTIKQQKVEFEKPALLKLIIKRQLIKNQALGFYKFYARIQLIKMIDRYKLDMQANSIDFIYESVDEIRKRQRAMEYYHRSVRIREAKKKNEEGCEVSKGVTISYDRIEKSVAGSEQGRESHVMDNKIGEQQFYYDQSFNEQEQGGF